MAPTRVVRSIVVPVPSSRAAAWARL